MMKDVLFTILRNKETNAKEFRKAAQKLATLAAVQASSEIDREETIIHTPISQSKGYIPTERIILVPILRAGLALLPSFLEFFEEAKVGFFGLRRDEKTAEPIQYFESIPALKPTDRIFLLDPLLATGGSSLHALNRLLEKGAIQEKIFLTSFIASPEGIKAISEFFPKVNIRCVTIDETLNAQKYIVPGLGDFGDRFFDTME